jgi:hypothetical protein
MATDAEIARLIHDLDESYGGVADEAEYSLIKLGPEVVGPLIAAIPSLGHGKVFAINVLEAVGDRRAGPVLIDLLGDKDDVVRHYAARTLATLGIKNAVSALQHAYEETKGRGTPPDWSEPEQIRDALTLLGARPSRMPPLSASLRVTLARGYEAWPSNRIVDVVQDFVAHDQLVYALHLSRLDKNGQLYVVIETPSWKIDWNALWAELFSATSRKALEAAASVVPRPDVYANVGWLDQSDLKPRGQGRKYRHPISMDRWWAEHEQNKWKSWRNPKKPSH